MVSLELTNACNMQCPHCGRSFMNRSEGFMEEDVFRKLVDELRTYRYAWIKICGLGEPGCHPKLAEFLDYLQGSGIKLSFTTNGTLLERFSPEQIYRSPIHSLGISIDGLDAQSYERLRPGGDYAALRQNIVACISIKRQTG
jgi:MoaA/NifB/PqqE/SkfB family radical SAM enzyme